MAGSIKSDGQLAADREAELNRIDNALDELEEQLELGGVEGSLAPILLDQLRTLPTERDCKQRLARISSQHDGGPQRLVRTESCDPWERERGRGRKGRRRGTG